MTIKEKFNEYAEIPANLDLENTMRERNGAPIILCVPLDEAILICQEAVDEACKKARIDENQKWINSEYHSRFKGILRHEFSNRIIELSSPLDKVK